MKKWQYKLESFKIYLEEDLNLLGELGWELINISWNEYSHNWSCIFKREKEL